MEKQADNRRTSRSWSNQQGAVLVFFVLLLPILFVFMGLVIDVGIAYHERRTMQTAADAGAIAGAREVQKENVGQITPAVLTDAALNGYDSNNGADITVNSPPQNGHKAGDEAFVEVIIRQAVPTYLMRLLNFDLVDVSTRAVAGVGPPDNCIWVLDPDAEKAFNVESGSSVKVGCGIQVDSNSSIAMSITSGSYVEATSIKIVGDYEATSGSSVDPTPDTGVSPVIDPMAEMSAPTYGACDYFDTLVDGGSATLYPGVYCGNPAIKINSANVTFMPGQYILMGGLHIDQGTIQAVGVSFYNTAGGGYNYEPIFIGSNVVGTFSAPISGDMMGVLFFTDRNAPEDLDNRIQSNTQLFFTGLLYFPTQLLSFLSGTSGISPNTMIVARLLKVSSNSTLILNSDFSDEAPLPTALSRVTLVE